MVLVESEPGLSLHVEKSSWLIYLCLTILFLLCWPCWAITAQVHLFQLDSVKSTLSLCKHPSTRNHHRGCAHSHNCKDGWERVREGFFSLWKYQGKFKALHPQWNIADLQAVIQSGDESQNTHASAKAGFHFCTSTCKLYWQKKQRQGICHKAGWSGTWTGENGAIFSLVTACHCLPRKI